MSRDPFRALRRWIEWDFGEGRPPRSWRRKRDRFRAWERQACRDAREHRLEGHWRVEDWRLPYDQDIKVAHVYGRCAGRCRQYFAVPAVLSRREMTQFAGRLDELCRLKIEKAIAVGNAQAFSYPQTITSRPARPLGYVVMTERLLRAGLHGLDPSDIGAQSNIHLLAGRTAGATEEVFP